MCSNNFAYFAVQKDQVRLEGDESFDEFYQSIVLSFDEFVRQFPKEPPGITMIEEYPQSIPTEHHSVSFWKRFPSFPHKMKAFAFKFQSPGKKRVNFNEEEEAEMSSIIRYFAEQNAKKKKKQNEQNVRKLGFNANICVGKMFLSQS